MSKTCSNNRGRFVRVHVSIASVFQSIRYWQCQNLWNEGLKVHRQSKHKRHKMEWLIINEQYDFFLIFKVRDFQLFDDNEEVVTVDKKIDRLTPKIF